MFKLPCFQVSFFILNIYLFPDDDLIQEQYRVCKDKTGFVRKLNIVLINNSYHRWDIYLQF